MRRKGLSVIITYIIILALVIAAVGVAFVWGSQELRKMEDQQQLQLSEGFMRNLDTSVSEMLKEGLYSARTLDVDLSRGELFSKGFTVTLSPSPTVTAVNPFDWTAAGSKYNLFNFLGFRQNVISDVVTSTGIPARTGNVVKKVTGARQAYFYEIYEAQVGISVESEVVYNPLKTTGDKEELKIYVTVYLTDFNFATGQTKNLMKLRLQNKGYQNFLVVDSPWDANTPYTVTLAETGAADGERYYVELDSANNRVYVRYLPSYASMAFAQRITLDTILLPKNPTSCNSALYDCVYFKVIRTTIDANMVVIV